MSFLHSFIISLKYSKWNAFKTVFNMNNNSTFSDDFHVSLRYTKWCNLLTTKLFLTLEESETPSMVLSNYPSNSESDVPTVNTYTFPKNMSSFMPSRFRSINITEVHGLSSSLMLCFNSSIVNSLILPETNSDMLIEVYSYFCTLVPIMLTLGMPVSSHSDIPSNAPSLQPSYFPSLE